MHFLTISPPKKLVTANLKMENFAFDVAMLLDIPTHVNMQWTTNPRHKKAEPIAFKLVVLKKTE